MSLPIHSFGLFSYMCNDVNETPGAYFTERQPSPSERHDLLWSGGAQRRSAVQRQCACQCWQWRAMERSVLLSCDATPLVIWEVKASLLAVLWEMEHGLAWCYSILAILKHIHLAGEKCEKEMEVGGRNVMWCGLLSRSELCGYISISITYFCHCSSTSQTSIHAITQLESPILVGSARPTAASAVSEVGWSMVAAAFRCRRRCVSTHES